MQGAVDVDVDSVRRWYRKGVPASLSDDAISDRYQVGSGSLAYPPALWKRQRPRSQQMSETVPFPHTKKVANSEYRLREREVRLARGLQGQYAGEWKDPNAVIAKTDPWRWRGMEYPRYISAQYTKKPVYARKLLYNCWYRDQQRGVYWDLPKEPEVPRKMPDGKWNPLYRTPPPGRCGRPDNDTDVSFYTLDRIHRYNMSSPQWYNMTPNLQLQPASSMPLPSFLQSPAASTVSALGFPQPSGSQLGVGGGALEQAAPMTASQVSRLRVETNAQQRRLDALREEAAASLAAGSPTTTANAAPSSASVRKTTSAGTATPARFANVEPSDPNYRVLQSLNSNRQSSESSQRSGRRRGRRR